MSIETLVHELRKIQADSTVFYQRLRQYHWNVRGRRFLALHSKFEELYESWAEIIDEVAEAVVILGETPLTTLRAVLHEASLEEDEEVPAAEEMIRRTAADLAVLVARFNEVAAEAGDGRAANLLEGIRDEQQKELWMLRAMLAVRPHLVQGEGP
ncbi:MAG: DNA starvation/stationary phase protection protein [Acidobacteria bacterium]|jgi:starvation-inducible DNA-binding protein|nr:DNA starvation/stationary phase protection protein [Acidobacteriota bacterium]